MADANTVQKWFSLLCDGLSKYNVRLWLPLVKNMKLSGVKKYFTTVAFSEQWQVDDDEIVVSKLEPCKKYVLKKISQLQVGRLMQTRTKEGQLC